MKRIPLGLAVGGVPIVISGGKVVAIGFHCKTDKAPPEVTLGKSDSANVLRPSPFQLQKVSKEDPSLVPRELCVGKAVNMLVAVDGVQGGPVKIGEYSPIDTIPLCINMGAPGPRSEEAVLLEVESLAKAKSVFSDGEYATIELAEGKASIEGKEIPLKTLQAWAAGDDSAPMDHGLNFQFNGKAINMVVPAANLVLFLLKT